jgi:hypothetical protein
MNGKLVSRWSLLGGALMASALMLGGCVTEAGDDEDVGETQAALNPDPAPAGGLVGVVDTGQGVILETPDGTNPDGTNPGDPNGNPPDPCNPCEPEPNPWDGTNPLPQNGGSPDPQQGPMGPQGQIKH